MPPAERRALLLLLGLALVGQGVRVVAGRSGQPPGAIQLVSDRPAGALAAHRDSLGALGRPLGPGERIDVDRATAAELGRLPGVGPSLARAIVADRDKNGPFGSLSGLDRVRGVGPGLLGRVAGQVSFSGTPEVALSGPPLAQTTSLASSVPSPGRLNLNTATAGELVRLPGIGPVRARRIVEFRQAHGPFASVAAVGSVPGVGPAVARRLEAVAGTW